MIPPRGANSAALTGVSTSRPPLVIGWCACHSGPDWTSRRRRRLSMPSTTFLLQPSPNDPSSRSGDMASVGRPREIGRASCRERAERAGGGGGDEKDEEQ